MVFQHARNSLSFPRQPGWPTVVGNDTRENLTVLDRSSAELQRWDSLARYTSHNQNAEKHSLSDASFPLQYLGSRSERSHVRNATAPPSTIRRLRRALHGLSRADGGHASITRQPTVRNQTGAPLFDHLPVGSKSLLSPIDLETPSDQGNIDVKSRDLGNSISGCYYEGELQTGCQPLLATPSLDDPFEDFQARTKFADSHETPSVLQNGQFSTLRSHARTPSPQSEFPQRGLSYQEVQEFPVQKTWARAIEPGQWQGKNTVLLEGDPFVSMGGSRPTAIEDGPARRPRKVISEDSPLYYKKLESSLDVTEQGGWVEEAHFTTVTSPSKPQIITIPRRGSSTIPLLSVDGLCSSPHVKWSRHSVTPPEDPLIVPTTIMQDNQGHGLEELRRTSEISKAILRAPITPPNSPIEWRGTASEFSYPKFLRNDSGIANHNMNRYQPAGWILDELEFLVANFPWTRLQLDSPVIQHIRREFTQSTRSVVADPRDALTPMPHSCYSTHSRDSMLGPLSSHPVRQSGVEGLNAAQVCRLCTRRLRSSHSIHPPSSPTLRALQAVFPHAASHTLDCVQATSYALAYVSSVDVSYMLPLSMAHASCSQPFLSDPCYIVPVKAQETLGPKMCPEASRPGTSWLRPKTLECRDNDISRRRLESLSATLNELLRELLAEIDGRRLGTGDDALVRAVQEMIRLGEAERLVERVGAAVGEGSQISSYGRSKTQRVHGCGCPHEWLPDGR